MSESYASFVGSKTPEHFKDVLRELMAYDALCFRCNQLPRNELGSFSLEVIPSPLHWSRQTEYPWAILDSELDKSHRVLEISGGHSVLKFALAKRCRHVIDSEFEQWYMPTIQETIDRQCEIWNFDNITQVYADVRAIPYPDNWFDRVFCISVLEHVPDGHLLGLKEIVRVLKPGGILMLSMDIITAGNPGQENNFYCDEKITLEILKYLDIDRVHRPDGNDKVWSRNMDKEGVSIIVLLAKYVKPNIERE